MKFKVTISALIALLNLSCFSQVPLSKNSVSKDDMIKEGFWQNGNSLAEAYVVMYKPSNNASLLAIYRYDSTEFEYKYADALKAFFTKINLNAEKEFNFMSIGSSENTFYTIGYYIDKPNKNLVFQQLNCRQDSFKTTDEFYNFVKIKLTESEFLKPYAKFSNYKRITDLTAPKGYVNRTYQIKVRNLTDINLKDVNRNYISSNTLKPSVADRFSLVTLTMPNSGCPPCLKAIEEISNKLDSWQKELKLDHYVITGINKGDILSESESSGYNKRMGNKFKLYFDEEFGFTKSLKIEEFPVTLLINSEGAIIEKFTGDYKTNDLYNLLKSKIKNN